MPLPTSELVEAVGLEVEREAVADLGHFDDFAVHIEAGGALQGNLFIALLQFKAAAFRKGLHV